MYNLYTCSPYYKYSQIIGRWKELPGIYQTIPNTKSRIKGIHRGVLCDVCLCYVLQICNPQMWGQGVRLSRKSKSFKCVQSLNGPWNKQIGISATDILVLLECECVCSCEVCQLRNVCLCACVCVCV